MTARKYVIVLLLGFVCLGLSIGVVSAAMVRQRIQQRLNEQQARLNAGILGQQGQQIRANLMQDLGAAGVRNEPLRTMLARHGYTVQLPAATPDSATSNAVPNAATEKKP